MKTLCGMFEDHEVMYDDAHVHFTLLSGPRGGGERRAQLALVPAEGALDLPALSVRLLEEASLHLTAILGFGPLAGVWPALGWDETVRAQLLSDQGVHRFRIVTGVEDGAPEGHALPRGAQQGRGLADVATRAERNFRRQKHVAGDVDGRRQLGPSAHAVAFSAPEGVIRRYVTGFQPRGVSGQLRPRLDQAASATLADGFIQESFQSLFFSSRCSA